MTEGCQAVRITAPAEKPFRFLQIFIGFDVSGNSTTHARPQYVVVGLNHSTAPVEVRERLSWNSEQLPGLLEELQSCGIPGVALSTCNRSEFYFLDSPDDDGCLRLQELLVRRFSVSQHDLDCYLYVHRGYAAILHLFRVASGLDSMILGEEQIIGQARQAYNAAARSGATPGLLARLFQQASRAGRRVRRESGIGRNALSVSRASVELARSAIGDLSGCSVLVVGAGEAGQAAAEALSIVGVGGITIVNRTYARAIELAESLSERAGAPVIPLEYEGLPQALEESDIVIGCTGSPGYVLSAGMIEQSMAARPGRPMFLMDIAVPRDIDPKADMVRNVSLRDIDELQAISQASREAQAQQAAAAEALAAEEAADFDQWQRGLDSLPPVISLRQHAEDVRRRELQRTLKRLNGKLTTEEQESLEAMTRTIVNKLLHSPTVYLKDQPPPLGHQTAERIFGLEIEPQIVDGQAVSK